MRNLRKAETLTSLDKLNVSTRTRTFLKRNFNSIGDAIKHGRTLAYEQGDITSPKWESELVRALKDANFIRPNLDFTLSLSVARLYNAVYLGSKASFIVSVGQLSNEEYENFVGLSKKDIEDVKQSLYNRLSEKECRVLGYRFGLSGNQKTDLESAAHHFNTTRENIRRIESRALQKLMARNDLPALFDAPNELNADILALKDKLYELRKNPVFRKEREILMHLGAISTMPFRFFSNEKTHLCMNGVFDSTPITNLDLSVRATNCLWRAGMYTISDVIIFPQEAWSSLRNLGANCRKEIVEKMHEAGYEDFKLEV